MGFLRQSFFPFNALGMPSFNNSAQQGSYSLSFQVIFHRFFIFGNLGQKVASKKKLLASEVCSTLKYKY